MSDLANLVHIWFRASWSYAKSARKKRCKKRVRAKKSTICAKPFCTFQMNQKFLFLLIPMRVRQKIGWRLWLRLWQMKRSERQLVIAGFFQRNSVLRRKCARFGMLRSLRLSVRMWKAIFAGAVRWPSAARLLKKSICAKNGAARFRMILPSRGQWKPLTYRFFLFRKL